MGERRFMMDLFFKIKAIEAIIPWIIVIIAAVILAVTILPIVIKGKISEYKDRKASKSKHE